MVIPDAFVILGILTGILNAIYVGYFESSLIAICFCFVLLYSVSFVAERAFKKEALGEGDIKLSIMLGAFLGIEGIVPAIFIASIAGAITGITLILLKRIKREDYIPFGPFLSFGAVMAIFL
jgi:leader peptidase (prepilin peptidase)/N-methyltransferase